jgi:hypothetical protein
MVGEEIFPDRSNAEARLPIEFKLVTEGSYAHFQLLCRLIFQQLYQCSEQFAAISFLCFAVATAIFFNSKLPCPVACTTTTATTSFLFSAT